MALTLTPTVSGNSYATVEEAVAYAAYRVGGAKFSLLSPDQQIQALATARRAIDMLRGYLCGLPASDGDAIPDNLKAAQIELALTYVAAFAAAYVGDVINQNPADGLIKKKKVDVLETEWFGPRTTNTSISPLDRFPDGVQSLLAEYICAPPVGTWGTGTVYRGS